MIDSIILAAAMQQSPSGHVVATGETLSGIAASAGVSLAALEAANPQIANPDLIYTGETVNFAMPDGTEVVYMARLLNDDILALRLVVGSRLPMVTSSLGRSMLAFMDEAAVMSIVEKSSFEKLTEFTITDSEALLAELAKIRKLGYAFNDQEFAVGVRGIAAPVLGVDQRPIAALNLSIARPVKPSELKSRLAPQLLEAAADISERAQQMERFS